MALLHRISPPKLLTSCYLIQLPPLTLRSLLLSCSTTFSGSQLTATCAIKFRIFYLAFESSSLTHTLFCVFYTTGWLTGSTLPGMNTDDDETLCRGTAKSHRQQRPERRHFPTARLCFLPLLGSPPILSPREVLLGVRSSVILGNPTGESQVQPDHCVTSED